MLVFTKEMLILRELIKIRVRDELINEPLKFEKELGIRFFKECIYKFNQIEDLDKEIIFSFEELRVIYNLHNQEDFKEFMQFFHTEIDGRKNVFMTDKGDLIGGGVFSTKIYKDMNQIGAMINPYHKQFIYSKFDIDKWHSVKGNSKEIKKLEINVEDRKKLLGLMTTFIADEVKGKYSQRLLDLLMQFQGSGFFIMDWIRFKETLGIPTSYSSSDVDHRVIKKSKEEFKKIGLILSKVEKTKEGKNIKNIKIKFRFEKIKQEKNSETITIEATDSLIKKSIDSDFSILYGKLFNKIRAFKNFLILNTELSKQTTIEELEKFKEKYKISI